MDSASACTWQGDGRRIVNNGDEPWKRLYSKMGPVLDDNDDAISDITINVNTPCFKKTSTHIIGYKLRNSCPTLIIFDIKIPHII